LSPSPPTTETTNNRVEVQQQEELDTAETSNNKQELDDDNHNNNCSDSDDLIINNENNSQRTQIIETYEEQSDYYFEDKNYRWIPRATNFYNARQRAVLFGDDGTDDCFYEGIENFQYCPSSGRSNRNDVEMIVKDYNTEEACFTAILQCLDELEMNRNLKSRQRELNFENVEYSLARPPSVLFFCPELQMCFQNKPIPADGNCLIRSLICSSGIKLQHDCVQRDSTGLPIHDEDRELELDAIMYLRKNLALELDKDLERNKKMKVPERDYDNPIKLRKELLTKDMWLDEPAIALYELLFPPTKVIVLQLDRSNATIGVIHTSHNFDDNHRNPRDPYVVFLLYEFSDRKKFASGHYSILQENYDLNVLAKIIANENTICLPSLLMNYNPKSVSLSYYFVPEIQLKPEFNSIKGLTKSDFIGAGDSISLRNGKWYTVCFLLFVFRPRENSLNDWYLEPMLSICDESYIPEQLIIVPVKAINEFKPSTGVELKRNSRRNMYLLTNDAISKILMIGISISPPDSPIIQPAMVSAAVEAQQQDAVVSGVVQQQTNNHNDNDNDNDNENHNTTNNNDNDGDNKAIIIPPEPVEHQREENEQEEFDPRDELIRLAAAEKEKLEQEQGERRLQGWREEEKFPKKPSSKRKKRAADVTGVAAEDVKLLPTRTRKRVSSVSCTSAQFVTTPKNANRQSVKLIIKGPKKRNLTNSNGNNKGPKKGNGYSPFFAFLNADTTQSKIKDTALKRFNGKNPTGKQRSQIGGELWSLLTSAEKDKWKQVAEEKWKQVAAELSNKSNIISTKLNNAEAVMEGSNNSKSKRQKKSNIPFNNTEAEFETEEQHDPPTAVVSINKQVKPVQTDRENRRSRLNEKKQPSNNNSVDQTNNHNTNDEIKILLRHILTQQAQQPSIADILQQQELNHQQQLQHLLEFIKQPTDSGRATKAEIINPPQTTTTLNSTKHRRSISISPSHRQALSPFSGSPSRRLRFNRSSSKKEILNRDSQTKENRGYRSHSKGFTALSVCSPQSDTIPRSGSSSTTINSDSPIKRKKKAYFIQSILKNSGNKMEIDQLKAQLRKQEISKTAKVLSRII
jgi:hypothetical protein